MLCGAHRVSSRNLCVLSQFQSSPGEEGNQPPSWPHSGRTNRQTDRRMTGACWTQPLWVSFVPARVPCPHLLLASLSSALSFPVVTFLSISSPWCRPVATRSPKPSVLKLSFSSTRGRLCFSFSPSADEAPLLQRAEFPNGVLGQHRGRTVVRWSGGQWPTAMCAWKGGGPVRLQMPRFRM